MRLTHNKADWLPKIIELNRACFTGVQRAPDSEVTWRINSPECVVFIIRTTLNELIGFAICEPHAAEVQLWSIAVREDKRGLNFGGYLLDEARQYFETTRLYSVMSLNVHVDNAAAIHLYERLGFRKVSVLKRWFLQDGDGIRMTKELV
jgi:ribosomal protein S18 acetylase RimI-like enzyme